jgi:hypothetical protein
VLEALHIAVPRGNKAGLRAGFLQRLARAGQFNLLKTDCCDYRDVQPMQGFFSLINTGHDFSSQNNKATDYGARIRAMDESSTRVFARRVDFGLRKHAQNRNTDAKPICHYSVLILVVRLRMFHDMRNAAPPSDMAAGNAGQPARRRANFLQPCLARVWIVPSIRRGFFLPPMGKSDKTNFVSRWEDGKSFSRSQTRARKKTSAGLT